MFFQYFTHVPVAVDLVQTRVDEVRANLEEWAGIAYRDGEELRANVGPVTDGYAKSVRLEIGPPEIRRAGIVYPVSWTAVGASALFPRLTAHLVLTQVAREKTKVCLEGTYEPPLGPVGRTLDRLALKNLAEATIQGWVDRVAEAVTVGQGQLNGRTT